MKKRAGHQEFERKPSLAALILDWQDNTHLLTDALDEMERIVYDKNKNTQNVESRESKEDNKSDLLVAQVQEEKKRQVMIKSPPKKLVCQSDGDVNRKGSNAVAVTLLLTCTKKDKMDQSILSDNIVSNLNNSQTDQKLLENKENIKTFACKGYERVKANTVSVVVGCRNRLSFLRTALPSWLSHPEVHEIIIVDWSSDEPVEQALQDLRMLLPDGYKFKVFRVSGVDRWILSLALNFGISHCNPACRYLLKLDCDSILHSDFFEHHPFPIVSVDNAIINSTKIFYSGNWKHARDENEKHLNGCVMVEQVHINAINHYHEGIREYGYDDCDLYKRLCTLGLTQKQLSFDHIKHIPHSEQLRCDQNKMIVGLKTKILCNYFLTCKLPWRTDQLKTTYTKHVLTGCTEWRPVKLALNHAPDTLYEECMLLALRTTLDDLGFNWETTLNKSLNFLVALYERRECSKIYIEPKNGLGNRLRALASAAVIAEATNKILIVVWQSDFHCDVKFGELFESNDILIVSKRPSSTLQCEKCQRCVLKPNNTSTNSNTNTNTNKNCNNNKNGNGNGTIDFCFCPSALRVCDTTSASCKFVECESPGHTYIVSACVINNPNTNWEKESEWLRKRLRPIPMIQKQIMIQEQKFDFSASIGVHIRMGLSVEEGNKFEDFSTWSESQQRSIKVARNNSHVSVFAHEMQRLWRLPEHKERRFFICADNPLAYTYLEKRFPQRILACQLYWLPKRMYDRGVEQLTGALVDVLLLSKCRSLIGSSWSSFTELVARFGGLTQSIAGKDFMAPSYALLHYPGSLNIGDDIQSLAAQQFLPTVDFLVDRDAQDNPNAFLLYKEIIMESKVVRPLASINALHTFTALKPRTLKMISNGWFDGRVTHFPYHPTLDPLYLSFHLNESKELFQTKTYSEMKKEARLEDGLLTSLTKINVMRQHEPIGARDLHTLNLMRQNGIEAFHSSCLTLTLLPQCSIQEQERQEILVVDAHISEAELYKRLVPVHIKNNACLISHCMKKYLPFAKKQEIAKGLLQRYQKAKLVITSRLHCALPCIAFRTPVCFLMKNMNNDCRFDDTFRKLFATDGTALPTDWDWDKPTLQESQIKLAESINKSLRKHVASYI